MENKLDIQFIKTFIHATLETLKVQCSKHFIAGKSFSGGSQEIKIDIAGVIGLTSKTFKGSIVLGFPDQTFLKVMNGMLGEEFTEISQDLQDGAGELLNIIFGTAKRELNNKGYELEKAIPTIVRGADIKVSHKSNQPSIVVPFQSDDGQFFIEIVLE